MNVMWKALFIFIGVCLLATSVVNNLYLRLELKEIKEKLSWYTTPVAPVPTVYAEPEVSDDEA